MMSGYIRRYITRGGSWYGLGSGVAMGLSVLLAGCGGYESNFSCKGYPDQATCESVSEAYEKRFSAGQKVTRRQLKRWPWSGHSSDDLQRQDGQRHRQAGDYAGVGSSCDGISMEGYEKAPP